MIFAYCYLNFTCFPLWQLFSHQGISWPFGTNQTSDSTNLKGVGLRPRINDIVVGSSRISSIESSRPNSPRSKNVSIQWKSQNTNQSENLQSQNQLLGGCISKRLECTRTFTKCRTYTRRNVADLFCQCSEFCSEVSTFTNPQNGEDNFNLQCSLVEVTGSGLTALSIPSKQGTLPVWCKFIPFFSYTWDFAQYMDLTNPLLCDLNYTSRLK